MKIIRHKPLHEISIWSNDNGVKLNLRWPLFWIHRNGIQFHGHDGFSLLYYGSDNKKFVRQFNVELLILGFGGNFCITWK